MMSIDDTIRAFQCCIQLPPMCEYCPQKGPGFGIVCKQNIKDSVKYWLETARVQQPRVMTLDEVRESKDPIMREVRGIGLKWATYYTDYENYGEMICRLVDYDAGVDDRYASAYGVYWRCWTARPTDEQREAEPWD